MAALARALGEREVLVNMSQMTVSQMSATRMTDSPQQRQHWLAEQVLDWSGLPVVHLRPTVFLDNPFFLGWAADSIAADSTICLPPSGNVLPLPGVPSRYALIITGFARISGITFVESV